MRGKNKVVLAVELSKHLYHFISVVAKFVLDVYNSLLSLSL